MSKNLWTKKEILLLCKVVLPLIKNPPINWYTIAGKINTRFDNGRTFRACENKYRRIYPWRITKKWTNNEICFIKTRVTLLKRTSRFINWTGVASSTNAYYNKNRTANACKQKYYETIKCNK